MTGSGAIRTVFSRLCGIIHGGLKRIKMNELGKTGRQKLTNVEKEEDKNSRPMKKRKTQIYEIFSSWAYSHRRNYVTDRNM